MKQFLIFTMMMMTSPAVFGQATYGEAMQAGLDSLKSIRSQEDFASCANHFDRIASVETGEWLPLYYSAYCRVVHAFKTQDTEAKEKYLMSAGEQIDAALKIAPEEAELYVLKGMYFQAMIGMDPSNNARVYSQKAGSAFGKALRLDDSNPRALYLNAMNVMYTPEQFGGGLDAACPLFTKAYEAFVDYQPESLLHPGWGKEDCENYYSKCTN